MIGKEMTLPSGKKVRVYGTKAEAPAAPRKAAYVDPETGSLADVVKALVDAGLMEAPMSAPEAPKRKPGRPRKNKEA